MKEFDQFIQQIESSLVDNHNRNHIISSIFMHVSDNEDDYDLQFTMILKIPEDMSRQKALLIFLDNIHDINERQKYIDQLQKDRHFISTYYKLCSFDKIQDIQTTRFRKSIYIRPTIPFRL